MLLLTALVEYGLRLEFNARFGGFGAGPELGEGYILEWNLVIRLL